MNMVHLDDNLALLSFYPSTDGAKQYRVDQYTIMVSCFRIRDPDFIAKYVDEYGLGDPELKSTMKKCGFRITANMDDVKVYRNNKFPISVGSKRWVFNLSKKGKGVCVFSISIEVFISDKPNPVELTTRVKIDAAMLIYEEAIARAGRELAKELYRINANAITESGREAVLESLTRHRFADDDEPKPKVKAKAKPVEKTKTKVRVKTRS